MEIDRLFREAEVVATDVAKLETSPFYLWCHYFAPDDARDPRSDYMQMLAERGNEHEREVVDEEFPGLEEFRPETTEDVLERMQEGVEAFDNVPLFSEDGSLAGKPDLLERKNFHGSRFGDFHYVVKEIKTVKRPAEHKEYVLQAAFYNYLLGELQRYTPEEFYIVNREGEETAFRFDNYKDRLFEALEQAERIKNGVVEPSPTLDTPYPWQEYSKEKAWEAHDVSLINGVGSTTKQRLQQHGFDTVEDVYEASVDELTEVHRVGRKTAEKFRRYAKALIEEEPVVFDSVDLPAAETEIFFDLEATMPDDTLGIDQKVNYLFGLLVREDGSEEFVPLVADSLDEEDELCEEFVQAIEGFDDFVIYYYSFFEKVELERMFDQYGVPQDVQERIMDNAIDLRKVVKRSVTFPTTKNGLKEIARYLGFEWEHDDIDAQESMAWYLDYLNEGDEEKMQKIIDYNRDDCEATRVIKDWLVENVA